MITSRIPRRRTVPANRRFQTRRRLDVETLECRQLLSGATVPTAAQPASTGTSDAPGDLSTVYLSNTNTSPVVSVGSMTFILANVNGMNQVWRSYGYVSPAVAISPLTTNVSEVASTGTGLYILADTNWGNSGASQAYQVFRYTGSGTNSSWTAITGTNTNVSQITANGTGLFMLGYNGGINQVWRYTGSGTNWTAVTSTYTVATQLTSTGTGVYMAAITGWVSGVWVYNNSGTSWSVVAPSSMGTYQIVSTGKALYQLANSGGGNQILEYSGAGTNWTTIAGTSFSPTVIAAAGSDLFMLSGLGNGTSVILQYEGSGSNWTGLLDDPVAFASDSPAPAGTPLFPYGMPYFDDVVQGQTGDCWLLASLSEVAARDPQDIENMFVPWGSTTINGSSVPQYLVRLYQPNGTAIYVEVDAMFPGGLYTEYAQLKNSYGTPGLWVALAEKAYAEANVLGLLYTTYEGQDSYGALWGGYPDHALQAITGKTANEISINPSNIAAAWNAGQLIVLDTPNKALPSSLLVPAHAYAVVDYDASWSEPVEMYNPWGVAIDSGWTSGPDSGGLLSLSTNPSNGDEVYGLFNADAYFLEQNFSTQDIGTGTTPMPVATGPDGGFGALTAPADAKTRTIALVRHDDNGSSRDDTIAIASRPNFVAATGIEVLGFDDAGLLSTPRWSRVLSASASVP